MCAGCAMAAASAASGFRTWMQSQNIPWLTPGRIRKLTIAAMCAAGVISTIGFSGSTPAAHASRPSTAIHRAAERQAATDAASPRAAAF